MGRLVSSVLRTEVLVSSVLRTEVLFCVSNRSARLKGAQLRTRGRGPWDCPCRFLSRIRTDSDGRDTAGEEWQYISGAAFFCRITWTGPIHTEATHTAAGRSKFREKALVYKTVILAHLTQIRPPLRAQCSQINATIARI